jgi:hypothetical protein
MLATKACPGCGTAIHSERFCPSCSSAIPQFHEDFTAPAESPSPVTEGEVERAAQPSPPTAPRPVTKAPTEPCQSCGATPTAQVALRQETGKLLWRTRRLIEGRFCRDCGISLFRELQNRTLITGWWGLFSFFVNWATVARNVVAAQRLQSLLAPRREPDATHLGVPLDPGKPLVQRGGVWVAAAVMVILGAVVASEGSSGSSSTYGGTGGYTPPSTSYRAPTYYSPPGAAGNWSYAQRSAARSAATEAGATSSQADCLVNYLASRYSYGELTERAISNAVDSCG